MMKKGKDNRIKEVILVVIILYISLFGFALIENINNYDTMWTFQFSKKIADGYITYKDYNIVMTPLFAQITGLIFKITGSNMMIFEMIGVIYMVLVGTIIYVILRKLKIPVKTRIFIMLIIYIYLYKIMTNSYNILSLLFVLLTIYFEICKIRYERYISLTNKKINKSVLFKYNMITGIILGLAFLSKQNIGAYLILAITFTYFIKSLFLKKTSFANVFKELTIKAIFCICIILIEVIYFAINGGLYNFVNYAFLGISSFKKNLGSSLIKNLFLGDNFIEIGINSLIISTIVILPTYVYLLKNKKIIPRNNADPVIFTLLFFLMFIGLGYSIPLPNSYHLKITKLLSLLVVFIVIFSINNIRMNIEKTISKYIVILMIILPVLIGLINIYIYYNYTDRSEIAIFKGAFLPRQKQSELLSTKMHILLYEKQNNKPLYIITADSAIYSLLLDRNQGIFDLPLMGNLGKKDYIEIINKLEELKRTKGEYAIMILANDNDVFWQESKDVRKYIKDNYIFVEEYRNYSIYEYIENK